MNKFKDIISQSSNINNLPSISDICDILQDTMNEEQYEEEMEELNENWNGAIIVLQDGTEVQLLEYDYKCILHNFKDFDGDRLYKISENIYMCADCLTVCIPHDNLVEEYYENYSDKLVFPKSWTEYGVINWLRKQNKRQEEYYKNKAPYYYNDNDEEDDDDFDYEEYCFNMQEEFLIMEKKLEKKQLKKDKENEVWQSKECLDLYKKLLEYAGGKYNLSKSLLKNAKQVCINSVKNNKTLDFDKFKSRVDKKIEKKQKEKELYKIKLNHLEDLKYIVLGKKIHQITKIEKLTENKHCCMVKLLNVDGLQLISLKKMFLSKEDANNYLDNKI